jgi:hypothetical protein
MDTIEIEIKNIWGEEKMYPANKVAETFAQIAKTTQLTEQTLRLAKSLGYDIQIKTKALNF